MRNLLLIIIKLYITLVSPVLSTYFGKACRYSPTCSVYAYQAINKHGLRGIVLAYKRILRCNWKSDRFYDPVI